MSIHTNHKTPSKGQHKFNRYLLGYVLSIILTLAAFLLVDYHTLSPHLIVILVFAFAVIQAYVQVLCFIRSNTSSQDSRWNLIAFLFTLFVIIVVVSGSLWIMYNLNYHMVN